MAEETIYVEVTDDELDAAIEKAERALDGVQSVDEAVEKILADESRLPTTGELARLEFRLKAVLSRIPELREVMTMLTWVERFAGVSSPLLATLMTLPYILNMINQIRMDIESMKQRQLDYERMIREARGFTSREQFAAWQDDYYRQLELLRRGESPL